MDSRTSYIFTKDVLLLLSSVFQSFKVNNRPDEETGDYRTAFFSVSSEIRVFIDVVLGFGWNLGFGVRSRIGTGVRVRCGIWSRIGIGRCRGWGNIAPSLVPLHVPYASDGLDQRCSGSPGVPVLEFSLLKNILTPSVAWIHVSYPPAQQEEQSNISRTQEKVTRKKKIHN